jgi:hypothetical protein
MSQERRKRQQQRESPGNPQRKKKILRAAGLIVLFAAVGAFALFKRNHRYDDFAKCVASKHGSMYGLYWCEHCAEQKEMFGSSFRYIPYIECGIKGQRQGEEKSCQDKGVKLFPTWEFADGRHEGVMSMEALAERSGCALP